jgi:hypothetical protein
MNDFFLLSFTSVVELSFHFASTERFFLMLIHHSEVKKTESEIIQTKFSYDFGNNYQQSIFIFALYTFVVKRCYACMISKLMAFCLNFVFKLPQKYVVSLYFFHQTKMMKFFPYKCAISSM